MGIYKATDQSFCPGGGPGKINVSFFYHVSYPSVSFTVFYLFLIRIGRFEVGLESVCWCD